ncbi:uncharacterized protein LOC143299398 [Babylonia areolata]|uniref:uncharacterized protein LOC143299398 n=1 Tax=Babylonia areolata TaxID=304850 RepID=UPI003FD2D22A
MSDVMERTLASIPRLLSSTLLGGGRGGQTPRKSQPSQSFQNFLRNVDSARGHSEQAALVHSELSRIKQQFEQPDASVAKWCESFPEIIFCSILGYDVSFCHIYAMKLAAHGKGGQKRVGYLAASLLLDPTCEIAILITGTLHRDLMSSNMMDNLMALSTASELIATEHIPMMLPPVVKLLRHRQAMVRARAVHCMHAFFRRAPAMMQNHVPEVKGMLGDRDPGVLMAVVTTVESLVERSREEFLALGPALISILQQIRAYKFPAHFCYHGLPLPWLQVKLLKILTYLAPLDDSMTSAVIPLLSLVLRDTVGKEMMSLAILEECLMTIAALARAAGNPKEPQGTEKEGREARQQGAEKEGSEASAKVQPPSSDSSPSREEDASGDLYHGFGEDNSAWGKAEKDERRRKCAEDSDRRMSQWKPLLEDTSRCVASFLGADLPNLRYIGVKVLTQLVSVSVELAVPHRDKVVTCLNDPDLIVRRQTLSLLHRMAVPDNFKAVCATMLKHLQQGNLSNEADVIDMVVDISHRLNTDPDWYLRTIFPLLSWRLDQARLSSIVDSMLSFFLKTSQDSCWPQFPDLLFTTMVDNIINCEGKSDPSVKFSFHMLRFVSLPGCKSFPAEKFLAACILLLTCDNPAVELKNEVVLCVQALLLRGVLDKAAVLAWARDLLGKCDHTTPYHHHIRLSELLRLASLDLNLTSLSVKKLPEQMDFTLSFLDSSFKTAPKSSQPLLKKLRNAEEQEADHRLFLPQMASPSSVSAKSEEALSDVPSRDNSPLYAVTSPQSESGKEGLPSVLQTVPVVKRRWTKEGFNNNAEERKSSDVSPMGDLTAEVTQIPFQAAEEGDKEDLTQALFQGLSPSFPLMPPFLPLAAKAFTVSGSHKSSSSSGFESSSSQNSTTGTSAQDAPIAGNHDFPSYTTTAPTSQYALTHTRPELELDTADDEKVLFSLSSPSPPPPNIWKALHTAHMDSQAEATPDTEQPFSAALVEGVSSNLESASILSISDDSLENTSGSSIPNSPTKHTLQTQSHPSSSEEKGPEDGGDADETLLSLLLEAQMMEEKENDEMAEHSTGGEEGSLYSGFETSAQCTHAQDSRDPEL